MADVFLINIEDYIILHLQQLLIQQPKQVNMDFINIHLLKDLFQQYDDSQKLVQSFGNINKVCRLSLKHHKPQKILQIATKINLRVSSHSKNTQNQLVFKQINWEFGEFQIFIWIIIYKCLIHNICLNQFTDTIFIEIQRILQSRSIQFLKYETKVLTNFFEPTNDIWTRDEIQLFKGLLNQYPEGKQINWKHISYSIYIKSNCKYFKNINTCRQKWNNHLNPQVNRGKWTEEEDIQLFQLINKFGLRWARISRSMNKTRTEHMVKNRYNQYYQKWRACKSAVKQSILELLELFLLKQQQRLNTYLPNTKKVEEQFVKIQEQSFSNLNERNEVSESQGKERLEQQQDKIIVKLQEKEIIKLQKEYSSIIHFANFNQIKQQGQQNCNIFSIPFEQLHTRSNHSLF